MKKFLLCSVMLLSFGGCKNPPKEFVCDDSGVTTTVEKILKDEAIKASPILVNKYVTIKFHFKNFITVKSESRKIICKAMANVELITTIPTILHTSNQVDLPDFVIYTVELDDIGVPIVSVEYDGGLI